MIVIYQTYIGIALVLSIFFTYTRSEVLLGVTRTNSLSRWQLNSAPNLTPTLTLSFKDQTPIGQ